MFYEGFKRILTRGFFIGKFYRVMQVILSFFLFLLQQKCFISSSILLGLTFSGLWIVAECLTKCIKCMVDPYLNDITIMRSYAVRFFFAFLWNSYCLS